jgi:hypothetical protein
MPAWAARLVFAGLPMVGTSAAVYAVAYFCLRDLFSMKKANAGIISHADCTPVLEQPPG